MIDYSCNLLRNVHESVFACCRSEETIITVQGYYEYWHYGCDGFNDQGWGCGYRTLQTICSWVIINKNLLQQVPNIRLIQNTLVALEDKEKSFVGSRNWIGTFEVCLVLDSLFDVPSKIIHVTSGKELFKYIDVIKSHFEEFGSPIMMGGDKDCSSKCIVGIKIGSVVTSLLIVDPHFVGKANSAEILKNNCWVKWENINDFSASSFYNLCLPQVKVS